MKLRLNLEYASTIVYNHISFYVGPNPRSDHSPVDVESKTIRLFSRFLPRSISSCRKASILIPFPFAADNHQEVNARSLVDAGAAVMITEPNLSAQGLAEQMGEILGDEEKRIATENAAGGISRPAAASDICDVCLQLATRTRWRKGRAD